MCLKTSEAPPATSDQQQVPYRGGAVRGEERRARQNQEERGNERREERRARDRIRRRGAMRGERRGEPESGAEGQ